MSIKRLLRHALHPALRVHLLFPRQAMQAIADAIHVAESHHGGEIRVALEGALDWPELRRGVTPRQQAVTLFSELRVWDTEHNDGVLIYLLLAEHAVEIVADRGIASRVPAEQWQAVCHTMENRLRDSRYLDAVLSGVEGLSRLLAEYASTMDPNKRNELNNWPVVVKR